MTDLEDRLRISLRNYGESLEPALPIARLDTPRPAGVSRVLLAAAAVVVLTVGAAVVWQRNDGNRSIAPVGTDAMSTGSWSVPSPAPLAPRQHPHVLWTGDRFIVWGGVVGNVGLADGAMYDPASDSWSPLPARRGIRPGAPAVWAGDRMVVLSGLGGDSFDPVTARWASLPDLEGVASGSGFTEVVWAGGTLLGVGVHHSESGSEATLTTWRLEDDRWVEAGSLRTRGTSPAARYLTVSDQTWTHAPIATADGFVLWDDNSTGWRFTLETGWEELPSVAAYDGDVLISGTRVVWSDGVLVVVATGKTESADDIRVATLGDDEWSAWTVVGDGAVSPLATAVAVDDRVVLLGTFDGSPLLIDPSAGTSTRMDGDPTRTSIDQGAGWSGSALLVWGGQLSTGDDELSTADAPLLSGEGALWVP